MSKISIGVPDDPKYYPMTILWIEDREGFQVQSSDIIAHLATPVGEVSLLAGEDGWINGVFFVKGAPLFRGAYLMSIAKNPPKATVQIEATKAPSREAVASAEPAPAAKKPPKPPKQKSSFLEILFLLSVVSIGGTVYYSQFHEPSGPYDGPMSEAVMLARQVDPELTKKVTSPESLSPGQGILYVESHENPDSYRWCEAFVVGPNAVGFNSQCIGESSWFDSLKPGQHPTGYFLYSNEMPGHISVDAFPIREIALWKQDDANDAMVAIAMLTSFDEQPVSNRTGTAGYSSIDTMDPPGFVIVDDPANIHGIDYMQSATGCKYWANEELQFDSNQRRMPQQVTISPTCETGDAGAMRAQFDGERLLVGFYWATSYLSPPPDFGGSGEIERTVHGTLFSSDDFDRLAAARAGETPKDAINIKFSGDPNPKNRAISAANPCDRDVTIFLFNPGAERYTNYTLDGGSSSYLISEDLSHEFLFSVGRGSNNNVNARYAELDGDDYYMQPASTENGRVIITACTLDD